MAGAPKGNQNAVALKTDDLKLEAFKQYCQHLAAGKCKDGWRFRHPQEKNFKCTWRTMERYIKENPIVLEPIEKEIAECDAFAIWEETGMKMMRGEVKPEPAFFQIFMRNKFGWDREEKATTDSPKEFDQQLQIIKPVEKGNVSSAEIG